MTTPNRMAETWRELWVIYHYYTDDEESERWCTGPFPTSQAADEWLQRAELHDQTNDIVPLVEPD